MSGFAMGSVLVNYYRKKSDDDGFIPRVRVLFFFSLPNDRVG
jgi:hypothetical protein